MSLFPSANDFKAGPGVEKDAPRKTGVGRFFELVGRDMSSMFLANLLTCLGFLPVICLVYIGFLMNSLPVMLVSAAAVSYTHLRLRGLHHQVSVPAAVDAEQLDEVGAGVQIEMCIRDRTQP